MSKVIVSVGSLPADTSQWTMVYTHLNIAQKNQKYAALMGLFDLQNDRMSINMSSLQGLRTIFNVVLPKKSYRGDIFIVKSAKKTI